jgi:cytochrome c-type biogenesis protein CcmH/NrfG
MSLLRGLFGGRREEEDRRIDVLEEAQAQVQEHPDDTEAHFDLGSIYYVRGRVEDAVSELEHAVELAPDHSDANYMLGLAYAKLGRYEDARRVFQRVSEKADNPMLQNYAHQKLKELEGRGEGEIRGQALGSKS